MEKVSINSLPNEILEIILTHVHNTNLNSFIEMKLVSKKFNTICNKIINNNKRLPKWMVSYVSKFFGHDIGYCYECGDIDTYEYGLCDECSNICCYTCMDKDELKGHFHEKYNCYICGEHKKE